MADEKTDADVIIGGTPFDNVGRTDDKGKPAAPAVAPTAKQPEAAAASKTKVAINGQEFEVTADVAVLVEAMQADFKSKMQQTQQTTPTPKVAAKPEEYDYEIGLFTEPKVALARLREEIKTEIRGETQQARNEDLFWNSFYADPLHSGLKEFDFFVKAVLNQHFNELKDLRNDAAAKKLGELANTAIGKLTKGKAKEASDRTTIEGGSTSATKTVDKAEQQPVTSLSDVIRARQAKKRAAAVR